MMKRFKNINILKYLIVVLSAIIVFSTTYALILPAITLEVTEAETVPGIYLENGTDEEQNNSLDLISQAEAVIENPEIALFRI